MKPILPLALAILLINCTRLENSNQVRVMECGQTFDERNHLKLVMPDGSDFPPGTRIEANIMTSAGVQNKLATTSKSCVLYAESQWPQNSWLHVKASLGEAVYSSFQNTQNLGDIARLRLAPRNPARFEWTCPLPIPSSATRLVLATDRKENETNHYVLEYALLRDGQTLSQTRIIQPDAVIVDMERDLKKSLTDGTYTLSTRLYDLDQDVSLQTPAVQKTCLLNLDRSAPAGFAPDLGGADLSLLDRQILRVAPSRAITFKAPENFDGQFLYCLEPIDEKSFTTQKMCADRSKFAPVTGNNFLPNSGVWSFHYFARDAAGNESAMESRELIVIDDLNLEQIRSVLSAAISLAMVEPAKAFELALSAYQVFKDLATDKERSLIASHMQKSLMATGLEETALEVSASYDLTSVQYAPDGSQVYTVQWDSLEIMDRQTFSTTGTDIAGENLFLDAAHDRAYTWENDAVKIFNLKGKVLNTVPFPSDNKNSQITVTPDGTFVLIYGSEAGFILLKDDQRVSQFEDMNDYSSFALTPDGHLKFVFLDQAQRTVTEKIMSPGAENTAVETRSFLLNETCFKDPRYTWELRYSHTGQFLEMRNSGGQPMEVFDLQGKSVACAQGVYDRFVFRQDDRYLTHIRNQNKLTSSAKTQFSYALYQLDGSDGPALVHESIELDENSFVATYVGTHQLLLSTSTGRQILVNFDGAVLAELKLKPIDMPNVAASTDGREIIILGRGRLFVWTPGESSARSRAVRARFPIISDTTFGQKDRLALSFDEKIYLVDGPDSEPRYVADEPEILYGMQFNAAADRLLVRAGVGSGFDESLRVLETETGRWHDLKVIGSPAFGWLGKGAEVLVLKRDQTLSLFKLTADAYRDEPVPVCGDSKVQSWKNADFGNELFVSCTNGQLLRVARENDQWTVVETLALQGGATILSAGPSGLDVVFEVNRITYFWKAGEKEARPISRSFYKHYVITSNGKVLAWDDNTHIVNHMDPLTGDEERLLELDNPILAFAYDPRHDLIAMSVEGGRILIYSGEGQLLVNKEFKLINKVLASLYRGVPSLVFQDEKLKIEAAGGAVSFHLPANRILKRYCDLQRNKDMSKDYWQKICGQN